MPNILNQIKLSGVTYDLQDASAIHSLDGYWTSAQTENAITAATNALAEAVAEEMSGKTDVSAFTSYTSSTESVISGKLDTSVFQTYSGNVDTALASKFAGAAWNSTDKKIYFYDNVSATGTALAYIDGTDFVKDGFLESVTIENKTISGESVPCLVFIWNTDAGIQETDIPLSGIFDPTNYVSVATFTAYTAATDTVLGGKASQSDLDSLSGTVTAHTSDSTIHVTSSDKTTWSGKQDALVNQVNIKSINGSSILGSGDLVVDTGLHASVTGTTLILE